MHCASGPSKRSFWVKKTTKKEGDVVRSQGRYSLRQTQSWSWKILTLGALTVFLLNNWDTAGKQEVLELDFYVCHSAPTSGWAERVLELSRRWAHFSVSNLFRSPQPSRAQVQSIPWAGIQDLHILLSIAPCRQIHLSNKAQCSKVTFQCSQKSFRKLFS